VTTLLETRKVIRTFDQAGTPVEVLRGVDLVVREGETVAVLGQSGSGKSTLLALLAGLDRPTSGEIHLGGQDLVRLNEEALAALRARRLGIIFQQFHLMARLTALENVSLPLELQQEAGALQRAADALDKVGLSPRKNHFPEQLSGGERQRVAIARALVIRPTVLLADEPSGNLDQKTGTHVMDVLFERVKAERATLLLVTHNDELARRCDRRVVLADGLLHEQA
jgi:putative ABC transport system ATP-binding protein